MGVPLQAGAAVAMLACGVLYRFPPAESRFYPACPIHQYTGLLCPGCGATRALALLLHGDVSHALQANALFVLLLPVLLVYGAAAFWRSRTEAAQVWPQPSRAGLVSASILLLVFTAMRNFH